MFCLSDTGFQFTRNRFFRIIKGLDVLFFYKIIQSFQLHFFLTPDFFLHFSSWCFHHNFVGPILCSLGIVVYPCASDNNLESIDPFEENVHLYLLSFLFYAHVITLHLCRVLKTFFDKFWLFSPQTSCPYFMRVIPRYFIFWCHCKCFT